MRVTFGRFGSRNGTVFVRRRYGIQPLSLAWFAYSSILIIDITRTCTFDAVANAVVTFIIISKVKLVKWIIVRIDTRILAQLPQCSFRFEDQTAYASVCCTNSNNYEPTSFLFVRGMTWQGQHKTYWAIQPQFAELPLPFAIIRLRRIALDVNESEYICANAAHWTTM